MKAVLCSEVELLEIAVFAEAAVWERRPELQLICASIPDRARVSPGEIEQALPGLSEAAQKNIIRHLNYLRLVDDRGMLTALGRRCAITGDAPMWELGGFNFLVASHPLFRCHVLHFKRLVADGRDWDFRGLEAVPGWFGADPARVWTSAFDGDLRFTLSALTAPRGFDPRCRVHDLPPAQLVWDVDLDSGENAWHVEGKVVSERRNVSFCSQPESIPAQKLAGMFATWDNRWDRMTGRLAMAYDDGAVDGRETFLRTFRYPKVKAGEFGTFTDVEVEGVPVGPSGPLDAQSWALELLVARVAAADAYCSKESWVKGWGAVVTGSPLEAGAGQTPIPDAVLRSSGKKLPVRTRWLLAAASDLAME